MQNNASVRVVYNKTQRVRGGGNARATHRMGPATMTGRTPQRYKRRDNRQPISDEDIYRMLMEHKYQRTSIRKLAQKYSLTETQVRTLIGRRTGGSCCG